MARILRPMRMSRYGIALLLWAGVVSAGLSTAQNQHDASSTQAEAEDDIREAVFRYRIAQLDAESLKFLSVNGTDPSDAFMARFGKSNRTVKKGSQSYVEEQGIPSLRDRKTKQPGMLFSVGAITWLAHEKVEVHGGMYSDGLCADAGEYFLEKRQGRWVVIQYKIEGVS
jgi:hypothetical protein